MSQASQNQEITSLWFQELRTKICDEFEKIEAEYLAAADHPIPLEYHSKPQFVYKSWNREEQQDSGGGQMAIMKGNVFEKVGVNFSKVYGQFSEEFRGQIPGTRNSPKFWASGISLVAHMRSPLVPAVHMNTRYICTEESWFGGGADLNPMFEVEQDVADFHQAFKNSCDKANSDYYPKFKKWCDDYFFIKHRNVSRGVGGIFYDYLNSENPLKQSIETSDNSKKGFAADFEFTKNVGLAFLSVFPMLVRRHMLEKWQDEQREYQLKKRGFYAEFNLLYDRGTKFGLMTGGNVEAILMSLPPVAKWE